MSLVPPIPRPGHTALSSREGAIFRALTETCTAPRRGAERVASAREILALVQPHCAAMDPAVQLGLRALLTAFEWAPWTAGCSPLPFSNLGPGERLQYCRAWERHWLSPVRTVFLALKALVGIAYCSHPAVEARAGVRLRCVP